MYLHKLEKDEKTAFIGFARHLAHLDDDKLDEKEEYMLRYMCAEMGLEPDAYASSGIGPYSEDALLKVFFREEARKVLILEGVGVCYCNGTFDQKQKAELVSLAGKLSLPEDFVSRADAVIQKQMEVMNEFDSLVS